MKHIVFIIILIHCTSIKGQTPIETWFDFQDEANGPAWLFKTDYGYITFSGLADINTGQIGSLISGIDPDGTPLWHKSIQCDSCYLMMNFGGAVIAAVDSGYYLVLNKYYTDDISYPIIYRISQTGDILWTKELLSDSIGGYAGFSITQSPSGDLYLAGYSDIDPDPDIFDMKFCFLKTDSQGNYIFHTETIFGNYPVPICLKATDDNIIVGGFLWDNPLDQSYNIVTDFVRKLDFNGNTIWTRKIIVPPAGCEAGVQSLLILESGNVIYTSGRSLGYVGGLGATSNTDTQPVVGELNISTGVRLWEQGFHDHKWQQKLFKIIKTSDGGYIGVGTHVDPLGSPSLGQPTSFVVKTDSNFNQTWYRQFVPSVWSGDFSWNNLTDIVENSNGTYTAVGLIYTSSGVGPQPGGYFQDTYLITVDSVGCILSGCSTLVEDIEIDEPLVIFPNPASTTLNLKCGDKLISNITFLNSLGESILDLKLLKSKSQSIDISDLSSGVYSIIISFENGSTAIKKFVKTESP